MQGSRLANFSATRKRETYKELLISHHFQPIAFESTGAFGQDALEFVNDLTRRSCLITDDPLSYLKNLSTNQCFYTKF